MKKKLGISFLLIIFTTSLVFGQISGTLGDVNNDSVINILDALMTAQHYVGLLPPNFNAEAADVNCDGVINIIDALQIAQFYVGLITKFTCPIVTPTPTPTPTPTSGTTPKPNSGIIRITDPAPGWASISGGTTGGGTDLSIAVTVSTMSDLQSKTSGSGKKIVLVKPGNYSGTLSPGANTTIIGTAPGVTIKGSVSISGSDKKNIIIRNIAIRGNSCGSYEACRSGSDAVYIGNGANHVWFDHVDVADGQDGNFDVTKSGDFVTASWTKFHYTYDKEHKFSNLIAGSDSETQSRGKLNITFMYCWWGDRVEQRQPRGRFGKIHCFNNLYTSQNTSSGAYHLGPGVEMAMIIENNYFTSPGTPTIKEWGSSKGWKATGNQGTASGMNSSKGSVFDVPYNYTLIPASQVQATVSASVGGAGNTCTFQQ